MKRLLLICLFIHFPCAAVWYESTGHAQIRNGDTDVARTQATEDAIKQALIFSGAQVQGVQSVANGIWQGTEVNIASHGSIDHIEIVDERHSDDLMSVTLRLDIISNDEACQQSAIKKSITITKMGFNNKQQAQMGQIFSLNKSVSQQLSNGFNTLSNNVVSVPYLTPTIRTKSFFKQLDDNKIQAIKQIANHNKTQYVLLSQINDVSLGDQQNSSLAFWAEKSFERFFNVDTLLFNGITGELVEQKTYRASGLWQYKKNAKVDVNSSTFWHSDYGKTVNSVAEQIVQDVNYQIACQPVLGVISTVNENTVRINLGKAHGLVKGQKLSVSQKSQSLTHAEADIVDTLHQVRVERVFQNYAIAHIIGDSFLANIQTNDLVQLANFDEPILE